MPDNTIDLGKSYDEAKTEALPESKGKTHYPSFYISDVEGLDDLPDGEFTFTGRGEVSSSTKTVDSEGNTSYSCEIEIHEITPKGGVKSAKSKPDSGELLDSKMSEIENAKEDSAEGGDETGE